MKDSIYVVFDKRGVNRMTKGLPGLSTGEFACKVVLEVEDKFFSQIVPEASLKIGSDFIIKPDVKVTAAAAQTKKG